jgi:hypothetical protein
MAAGQGFKTFTTGEVLTAGDVNGYLMQGINVFTNATARDAAITAPAEGQFAFTKDNNSLWYYDGAAWVASGATGDIEGVTAGVGISGGGTSGTVTVTNSMATAIDAKGDLVPGTGADTFARLAVGANNTVLTADSAEATGLKWATPSTGAMTLISTTTMSGVATQAVNPFSSTYENYLVLISLNGTSGNNATTTFQFRNGATNRTNSYYAGAQMIGYQATQTNYNNNNDSKITIVGNVGGGQGGLIVMNVTNVNGTGYPTITGTAVQGLYTYYYGGIRDNTEANDGFLITSSNNMTGAIRVYGVQKS